ncbi:hypothetical protein U1Q18_016524 [Sarracenia purpurea var. burkii]
MAKERIKIKKIDNMTARQVTFAKRRRGLFKKAEELAVLCDSDVALIIFSATGKLFQYASSSMNDVLGKYNLHASNIDKIDQPSLELQLENGNRISLSKEISERTKQLRQMRGEDIHGLDVEELQQLENMLQNGLSRVLQTRVERFLKESAALQRKSEGLIEENKKLKQKMEMLCKGKLPVANGGAAAAAELDNLMVPDEGQSSESATVVCTSCNGAPPAEDDSSNTSLRL